MRVTQKMVCLLVLIAGVVGAETNNTDSLEAWLKEQEDKFQLWNECKPVALGFDGVDVRSVIGLAEDRIKTVAESRLRVAGIHRAYDFSTHVPTMYIGVVAFPSPDSTEFAMIQVTFKDHVIRNNFEELGRVLGIWSASATVYGGAGYADRIIQNVGELTDKFINEYLRVNETACQ